MIIAVHPELRGTGYGTLSLDDLFLYLSKRNKR